MLNDSTKTPALLPTRDELIAIMARTLGLHVMPGCPWGDAADAILARHSPAPDKGAGKPWYETDAHRDLSRIIPDMEGKIAEAKVKFDHCLPPHLFAPLEASITELRVLRHELASPVTPAGDSEGLREAAQSFIDKYALCEPAVAEAFLHRQLRVGPYIGPDFGEELDALRAALATATPPEGDAK